jgi:hypothetical protein
VDLDLVVIKLRKNESSKNLRKSTRAVTPRKRGAQKLGKRNGGEDDKAFVPFVARLANENVMTLANENEIWNTSEWAIINKYRNFLKLANKIQYKDLETYWARLNGITKLKHYIEMMYNQFWAIMLLEVITVFAFNMITQLYQRD